MKTFLFAVSLLIFINSSAATTPTAKIIGDTSLQGRISEFLKANDEMNMEKIADYVYPKLFTLVPKADLVKAMKEGFDNEEMKVGMDSLHIKKIFPTFQVNTGQFAKVKYSLIILMNFKLEEDSTNDNNVLLESIMQSLAEQYGTENTSLDKQTGTIKIRKESTMVAVKDEYAKEWSFIELKEEDPLIDKLFTKEVLAKLASYN